MAHPTISPKAERVVSISPNVSVKRTKHIIDYTDEEIKACWYSKTELEAIHDQAIEIAEQMQGNMNFNSSKQQEQQFDESKFCSRGLEQVTGKGLEIRMQNRMEAWDTVLDEQEHQIDEGIYDDVALARAYAECCYNSAVAASAQGILDQRAIMGPSKKTKKATKEKVGLRSKRIFYKRFHFHW